jgi:hypothetical protein
LRLHAMPRSYQIPRVLHHLSHIALPACGLDSHRRMRWNSGLSGTGGSGFVPPAVSKEMIR